MRFKQTIYDSTRAPLALSPFPMRGRLLIPSHSSLVTSH